jgi:predicted NACHT family NTPase
MIHISRRSLKASKNGVQLASLAILRFPTKIDFAAELEISRSTVQNFFAGKPVGRENFHKICQELDLAWQEIAELPQDSASQLIAIAPEVSQPQPELTTEKIEFAVDSVVAEYRLLVRSRILSMCGVMRVLDMCRPKNIEDIYVNTRVYKKIKGRRRLEVDTLNDNVYGENSCYDFEEVLKPSSKSKLSASHYSKLIVLGKPGSGKTMFLKHLTILCLKGEFESKRIPIFISLRDFAGYNPSLSIFNYIIIQLTKDNQPPEESQIKQLLNQGKFFIVMDGLDEVNKADYISVCKHLRRFTEWFPNNRYIISCRHGVQYCNFEQFTELEIADFGAEQITDFAFKWFDIQGNDKSIGFLQKLEGRNSIQEFTTNPLLLTLLCILYKESADFPSSRSEIYEEVLEIVFKQWDAERSIEREGNSGLSLQQEKELLCDIALLTFGHKQDLFKEEELKFYVANFITNLADVDISELNVKNIIKSIESKYGLLVEQAKKVYSFSYQAFQEYLTAKKFVSQNDLLVSTTMLDHLVKNLTEERWREIFLLVSEMSPQADALLQMMSQKIDTQINQASELNIFLEWVNCKAQSVEKQLLEKESDHDYERSQFQPVTIRAFYLHLGLSQIFGHAGSSFDFALSLEPKFIQAIQFNLPMVLDLSLFHLTNITYNLPSIQVPALTFQNILNRAISYAAKIQPELAGELRKLAQQLPTPEQNTSQFWHWWHKHGKEWFDNINSLTVQYRNIGYQWQFDFQQKKLLKKYCQANILLIDCLNASCYASSEIKAAIINQLFIAKATKQGEVQIELMLRQNIA